MAKKNINQFTKNFKKNITLFEKYKIYYKDKDCKIIHRDDGPAVVGLFRKEWFIDGKHHRTDGPAIEYVDGYKAWIINGQFHRVGGPAVEHASGSKEWWVNGKVHREDGPAVEWKGGDKEWYINGKRHRLDGPAIKYSAKSIREGNYNDFYIDGIYYDEEEYWEKVGKIKFGGMA